MANDQMTLHVETTKQAETTELHEKISDAIRDVTKLRGNVAFFAPGSLPNDGRVIEDARSYT
jgi:phenylacetate-CoA ligase